MPKRLSDLISKLFYGGRLQTAESLSLRPGQPSEPCRWVDMNGRGGGMGEVAHDRKGYSNPSEAAEVMLQATQALALGIGGPVYIITPYNKQKKALMDALEGIPELSGAKASGQLQVLSVDACQGSEADCVILSLVSRANNSMRHRV